MTDRKRRLKTAIDLRRYLADLLNRVESGQVDTAEAKGRAYIASILMKCIEGDDHEQRLIALEAQRKQTGGNA